MSLQTPLMEWEADALARGDDPADVSRRRSQMDALWEQGESLIAAWDELRTALEIALEGERPERPAITTEDLVTAHESVRIETKRASEVYDAILTAMLLDRGSIQSASARDDRVRIDVHTPDP